MKAQQFLKNLTEIDIYLDNIDYSERSNEKIVFETINCENEIYGVDVKLTISVDITGEDETNDEPSSLDHSSEIETIEILKIWFEGDEVPMPDDEKQILSNGILKLIYLV